MADKYTLTDQTTTIGSTTLYRIKALKSFDDVKEGDLGGYIESKKNLSQDGHAWVYGFGKIHDNAIVYENGKVKDNAQIHDNSQVYGNAIVDSEAHLHDNSQVYGNGEVHGTSKIYDNVQIYDNGRVYGDSFIHGDIQIYGEAEISDRTIKYDTHRCGYEEICCRVVEG